MPIDFGAFMEAFTPQMRGALKSRWGEGGESAEEKKKAALQKALLEIGTKTAEGGGLRVYQEDDPTTMTPGATVLREEFGPGALDMWSGLSDVNRQKNEQEQAKADAELKRTNAEQQLKVFDKTVKAFDYLEKIDKQEGASPDAKKELRKTFLAAAKMSGIDLSQHEFDNIAQLKEAWQVEQGNKISELFQAWKEDRTTLNESVFLAMLSRAKGVVDTEVWKTAYNLANQEKKIASAAYKPGRIVKRGKAGGGEEQATVTGVDEKGMPVFSEWADVSKPQQKPIEQRYVDTLTKMENPQTKKPYTEPEAIEKYRRLNNRSEKPEYTPKEALTRISTIDATIARIKSSGTIDTQMAIKNPLLAALVDTKDPEAVKQAIASLESEKEYVAKFAPKGAQKPSKSPAPAAKKPLDEETAMKILKEAGGDKEKARAIAKQRGFSF